MKGSREGRGLPSAGVEVGEEASEQLERFARCDEGIESVHVAARHRAFEILPVAPYIGIQPRRGFGEWGLRKRDHPDSGSIRAQPRREERVNDAPTAHGPEDPVNRFGYTPSTVRPEEVLG